MNQHPFRLFLPLGAQHCTTITQEALQQMLEEGVAEIYCDTPPAYRELPAGKMRATREDKAQRAMEDKAQRAMEDDPKAASPPSKPDADPGPDQDPQTYQTRDMGAVPKRRRGRPRKTVTSE